MHYLSGIIGTVFVIVAGLNWKTPTIGGIFLISGVVAFLAIRPTRVTWWLFTCCVASAVAAAFFFYRFFTELVVLSSANALDPFDYGLLTIFACGFAMTYVVSEYCCWLKGRQDVVKFKWQLRQRRERFGVVELSRSR